MSPILAIALIWTWHTFWMSLLTYAVGRAAYAHAGNPIRRHPRWIHLFWKISVPKPYYWPVSGRWLITALLLMITVMMGDVARGTWTIWHRHYDVPISWWTVFWRGFPIFIEPACFWRQWTRGLTNDYPKRPVTDA